MKTPKLAFAMSIALCLTSCFGTPGKGWKAREGHRAADPIIVALEKFRADHSCYPAKLTELVPHYVPDETSFIALKPVTPVRDYTPPWDKPSAEEQKNKSPGTWFMYERSKEGYNLTFQYIGPGVCTCSYNSITKKWSASSYY